jgi:hypothetical protein
MSLDASFFITSDVTYPMRVSASTLTDLKKCVCVCVCMCVCVCVYVCMYMYICR